MSQIKSNATERLTRKTRRGTVVSNSMDKSIVVRVERITVHPLYKKTIRRSKRYHAHDENNECQVGDTVSIMECRSLSRTKRWRLIKVLISTQKSKDIQPTG